MKFDCGNGEIEIKVSFYTLLLYEQEFGGDMIKDLFGRVEITEDKSDGALVLDFTQTNWTAAAKGLWACAKTADEYLPHFKEWSDTMTDGVNMYTLAGNLQRAVEQELFRLGVAPVSEENEG